MHMHTQHLCFRYCSTITFFHNARPQTACRTEFSNFLKHIKSGSKGPGNTRSKIIYLLSGLDCRINISQRISKCKSDFLYTGSTGFTNMVSTYADRIPFWNTLRAIFKSICNQPHRRPWWENICATGNIFF